MKAFQKNDSHTNSHTGTHTNADAFLQRVHDTYAKELRGVNDVLRTSLASIAPQVPEIAGYVIRSGGKRLRPTLALIAGKLFSQSSDVSHKLTCLAAGIECIHTATLLHDDVVDEGGMRRGQPSANAVWGNALSVLVGDFLLSRAFDLIVSIDSLEVVRILSHTAGSISEGEVLQLTNHSNLQLTTDDYLTIIEAKTARLFAAGLRAAGVVAGASRDAQEALFNYGNDLGIMFQLVDDNLDYLVSSNVMGKSQGDDFREGKVTLPVLLAYARASEEEKKFWARAFVHKDTQPEDFLTAVTYMKKHHVFEQIMGLCYKYVERSKNALRSLPQVPGVDFLYEMVDFCLLRKK